MEAVKKTIDLAKVDKNPIDDEQVLEYLKSLKNDSGNDLLWIASAHGSMKCLRFFLDAGMDVAVR